MRTIDIFHRNKSLIYKLAFYLMVSAVMIVGLFKGVLSVSGSKDAQWYPAQLLSQNVDIYHYYLANYNDWFMRSVPNYYFQLYYMLQPFASMSWDSFKVIWFLLNASILLLLLLLIKKDFGYNYRQMGLIFLPFFIGFPLLSVFTNGQSTILILILIYLAWRYRENKILLPILLSLITMKYSIGIPIVLGFLLMGYYRAVFISGLLTLLFPLIYALQFNMNFLSAVFLPLKVSTDISADALGGGPSDLMSLYGLFFDGPMLGLNVLTISLGAFVILFSALAIKFRIDHKVILICSVLLSLFGFYHNGHDYTLFLLVLPFVLRQKHYWLLYGYLLIFCLAPRMVRLLGLAMDEGIGVKEFMYNKYFVIFNVCFLISYFFLLLRKEIASKRKTVHRRLDQKEYNSEMTAA